MHCASSGLARFPRQPVAICQRYPSEDRVLFANACFRAASEMKVLRSICGTFSHGLNLSVKPSAKPPLLAAGYSLSMDVATIRHLNLQALVSQLGRGGRAKKEVAVDLDMSGSFLSQLLGGKKMGDDVARKIEAAAGLRHGWMDVLQTAPESEPSSGQIPSQAARLDAATLAAAIELVRKACDNLGIDFDPEEPSDAALVLIACDHLNARGESEVTVDNLVDFTKRLRQKQQGEVTNGEGAVVGSTGGSSRGEGPQRKAS